MVRPNVYLSGGGSFKETYQLDEHFFKNSGQKILYLPVGLKRTIAGYDDCANWFNEVVRSHGYSKSITVWIELKNKSHRLNTNNFDAIYIGGASSTSRLHETLIFYGFYPQLLEFIRQGGLVYGGSGGATILGKSINYDDQLSKSLPLREENSLDVCCGYSVFAHLNKENRHIIEDAFYGDVIGIPEKGGCLLDTFNGELTYLGPEKCLIVTDSVSMFIKDEESVNVLGLKR